MDRVPIKKRHKETLRLRDLDDREDLSYNRVYMLTAKPYLAEIDFVNEAHVQRVFTKTILRDISHFNI